MTPTPTGTLEHRTLLYESDDEYVSTLAPFLASGVAAGRPAIAVVPRRNADLLRKELGRTANGVQFIAAEEWYETPARTIAGYDAALSPLNGQRPQVVGEVSFGDQPDDWPAWIRYEAVLNRVLDHLDCDAVCPYDTRTLPRMLVDSAAHTHPHVMGPSGPQPNPSFVAPEEYAPTLPPTLTRPRHNPEVRLEVAGSTRLARVAARELLRSAGYSSAASYEIVVGLNEVVSNAIVHGGRPAVLEAWRDGEHGLLFAVTDAGRGIADPFAGFHLPDPSVGSGRGLWLARQIFPRADIVSGANGGTTVLLWTSADHHADSSLD